MDTILYGVGIILFLISPIFLVYGLIKPHKFARITGGRPKRLTILGYALLAFILSLVLAGVFEPESIKQDRLAREQTALQEKQQAEKLTAQEKAQQEEAEQKAAEDAKKSSAKTETTDKPTATESKATPPQYHWYRVVEVIDGDTIKAQVDGATVSVRLIGIDASETNECFGSEATQQAKSFLKNGWVQLRADSTQGDKDKYGRLLRYVLYGSGLTDLGKRMIERGFAYEYTYDKPYANQALYKQKQTDAAKAKLGLWADKTCAGKREKPVVTTPAPTPAPAPSPAPTPAPQPTSNCDPNYTPCVPISSADLDCKDIGFRVRVIGVDRHGFDSDDDGYGCDSY